MKSKKALYFLIPLVVLVWGLIILRVLKMTHPMADDNAFANRTVATGDSVKVRRLQRLNLNYADPFLKDIHVFSSSDQENNETYSVFKTNPEPPKKVVRWPNIIYNGLVENSKNRMAIVQCDNKTFIVGKDQVIGQLEVLSVFSDSIIVKNEEEKRTFIKTDKK